MTSPTIATIMVEIDKMASRLGVPSHACEVALSRESWTQDGRTMDLGAVCWTVRVQVRRKRSGTAVLVGYGDTLAEAIDSCERSVIYNRKTGRVR